MNVSKKQLKEQVANNINMLNVKVKRSFVYVAVNYEHEGVLYHAFDFSKWATEDMTMVAKLTKIYKQMIEAKCGCRRCRLWKKQLALLIERYDWSENKGIAMATGRAVADIVQQIIEAQKTMERLSRLLETSGPNSPRPMHMVHSHCLGWMPKR